MNGKNERQKKIKEIISGYNIETQDELMAKLLESGFKVTQATVSRDIQELKLVKVMSAGKRYKYAISAIEDAKSHVKFYNILRDTIKKVDYANNLLVVVTYTGMANAAAAAIDSFGWNEIVGSVAGDDTILIVMRSEEAALNQAKKLHEIIES